MQQSIRLQNLNQLENSEQDLNTRQKQTPSHQLHNESRNFCIPSLADPFPVDSITQSQFQRYDKKPEKKVIQINPIKKEFKEYDTSINRSLSKPSLKNESYKDWKIYKNKSDLNMLPFPYCIDQSFQYKKLPYSPFSLLNPNKIQPKQQNQDPNKPQHLPKLYKLKIQNKIRVFNQSVKQNKVYRPYFNYEKTPINEYLNYELTEQINTGLRDVQIMAQEIKKIKKAKKVANQDDLSAKEKYTKGLRIRRSYVKNYKGLFKTNANIE